MLVAAAVVLGLALSSDRFDVAGVLPPSVSAKVAAEAAMVDWIAYGDDNLGRRYSDLNEINTGNVKGLKLAWHVETGDRKGPNDPEEFTNEATPLKIGELLYTCSPIRSFSRSRPRQASRAGSSTLRFSTTRISST